MSLAYFDGADEFYRMLRERVYRPRFRSRFWQDGPRNPLSRNSAPDQPLPLVCVSWEHGHSALLHQLNARFEAAGRPIPHALVDAKSDAAEDETPPGKPHLLPILHTLYERLRAAPCDTIVFSHYEMADWLTRQDRLPGDGGEPRHELVRRLRAWTRTRRSPLLGGANAQRALEKAAGHSRVLALADSAAGLIAPARFYLWVRLGRESSWLMSQRYLSPSQSEDFLGFAEALVEAGDRARRGVLRGKTEEDLHKLLVHAFLQDLRLAFRRRPWRLAGWRRTAYPCLLLDNAAADRHTYRSRPQVTWRLLRLINDVRNEIGLFDPLMVVAADAADITFPAVASPRPYDPEDAATAYRQWLADLPDKRQLLTADARYLLIKIDAPAPARSAGRAPAWQAPRAPVLARRGVVSLLVAVLAAAGTWWGVQASRPYLDTGCLLPLRQWAGDGAVAVRPTRIHTESATGLQCVGYSDNADQVFGAEPRLREAQRAIFAENRVAAELHERNPLRPFVSVVYFAGLTEHSNSTSTDQAQEAELHGLLMQQRQLHDVASKSKPLLRVVVANGGSRMAEVSSVVSDYLIPLAQRDPSIAAVIGLDRSNTATAAAITALGAAGVPVIATTLSADDMHTTSPLYFGLSSRNRHMAALLARYAADADTVSVYAPEDPSDNYVTTLVEALRHTLGPKFELAPTWVPARGPQLSSVCVDGKVPERDRRILYFAGRHDDFVEFARQVTDGCHAGPLPRIVGNDSVTRVVYDAEQRRVLPPGLPVTYFSQSPTVVLAGPGCAAGRPAATPGGGALLRQFCAEYDGLFAPAGPLRIRPPMMWVSERVGQAYDAVDVVVRAAAEQARHSRRAVSHRAAIAATIRDMDFTGVTGRFRFVPVHAVPDESFAAFRVADEKNLALLAIDDVGALAAAPRCVLLVGELYRVDQRRDPATGCPVPE